MHRSKTIAGIGSALAIAACFALGVATRGADVAPQKAASAPASGPAITPGAPAAIPASGAQPAPVAARRYDPPPVPDEMRELVGGADPPESEIQAHLKEIDDRFDERLGPDFPVEKRERIKSIVRERGWEKVLAIRALYHGEISQEDLNTRIHRSMLEMARQELAVLTADEYRRFNDLEPGADPYLSLVGGGKPGEPGNGN